MIYNYIFSILAITLMSMPVAADELFYGVSEEMGDASSSTSSKYEEELFSTPLSISIVTADQIKKSAVTTIAEAMKLVPGVMVREQTNGQFEVHIRGFQSVVSGSTLTGLANSKTLIMIDNRIVFDYFNGGLFWDTLPISVEDVDRIEVVRGAVSSLYGANAVTGVIHIFTKRGKDKTSIKTSLMAGTKNSQIAQVVAEKSFEHMSLRLSAMSEKRDRYEEEYFDISTREYRDPENINLASTLSIHDDPEQAVDKSSVMLSINNDTLNLFNYDFSVFYQDSDAQKVHMNSRDIPLTKNLSDTSAYNLKLNYGSFSSRFSQHWGKQETAGFPDFTYDTNISQASMSYQIKYPRWLIQPEIDWYHIEYDGSFIGGKREIVETNYMLRTEYNPQKDWRFISAISYSDFNAPEDNELNYQFLTTYNISFDTSLRGSIQTSSSSPFMVAQYIDIEFTFPNDPTQRVDVKGDKNGRLNRMTTYEIGLRHQLDFNNFLEVEVFHSELDDFIAYIIKAPILIDGQTVTTRTPEDLPQKAVQDGITINWLYESLDWNINAFLTGQHTQIFNQTESLLEGAETFDQYNKSTPKYYGGINANWRISESINLNVLSNYLHEHTFELQQPQGEKYIPSALYTNLTLNYQHDANTGGYLSIKNLSDQDESQNFYTDRLEATYWLGLRIKFGN